MGLVRMEMIEHDYDFHGFCHPFIEVGPGFYIRIAPKERRAWVVTSVKDRGRHPQSGCKDREIWDAAFGYGSGDAAGTCGN